MGFLPGKVPTDVLEKIVFKNLGAKRDGVILSPSLGEDAAIVKAGNAVLAVS
jgi:hydrogenase expression/formation protein HypE